MSKLLEDGGHEGLCGWLIDRFGVSVLENRPQSLAKASGYKRSGDSPAYATMMQMKKINIAELEAAVVA